MTGAEKRPRATGKWVAFGLVALGVLGMVVGGVQEVKRLRHLDPGTVGADVTFERWSGGSLSTESLRGKVILLDFWATWCPPCVEEMPGLVRVAKAYESRGVVFIAASRDEPSTWKTDVSLFADKRAPGLTDHAVLADDTSSDRYNVRVLPTLYIIGKDGRIHSARSGFVGEAELREMLERVLKETS